MTTIKTTAIALAALAFTTTTMLAGSAFAKGARGPVVAPDTFRHRVGPMVSSSATRNITRAQTAVFIIRAKMNNVFPTTLSGLPLSK